MTLYLFISAKVVKSFSTCLLSTNNAQIFFNPVNLIKLSLSGSPSQGIREAKKNGTQIGLSKGTTLITEKSIKCKEIIKKHAIDFGGTLCDNEVMTLCKISRNSYYKYKRELKLAI